MSLDEDKTPQLAFNDDVIDKLKLILEESSHEKTKDGIQQLILHVEQRSGRLRLTVTEEIEHMPPEMQCAVFDHRRFEKSGAGYMLKRRKRHLSYLTLQIDNSLYISGGYEMSQTATSLRRFEIQKKTSCPSLLRDYASAFLYVILAYYDISEALVQGTTKDLPLEDWLGVPLEDHSKRIKTKFLTGRMQELLPWVLPATFGVHSASKMMIDEQGQLLMLLDGVECVRLFHHAGDNVDEFMSKFRGPKVELSFYSIWSRENFNAVLTSHANGSGSLAPRCIQCPMTDDKKFLPQHIREWLGDVESTASPHAKTEDQWKELFTSWRDSHVAEFGEPKRQVNHEIVLDNGNHKFRFNLL